MKHLRSCYLKLSLIIAGCFLLAPSVSATVPEDNQIVFEILRNGSSFGTHEIQFSRNQDGTIRADIDINMKYSLGPVTLFRYAHQNTEIWQGDQILSFDSVTYDDGKDYQIAATWNNEEVVVHNGASDISASKDALSTSYWNKDSLYKDALINTQNGEIKDIDVTYKGTQKINFEWGTVEADVYDVKADREFTLYYDTDTDQWVGLKFEARGSDIVYRRINPITPNNY